MDPITTAVIALAAVAFMIYRQFAQRPVTAKDAIIPALGGLYLANRALAGAGAGLIAIVLGAAAIGLATGLASGLLVRVWQVTTGAVYQRGGWGYLGVIIALVALRIALRVVFSATGLVDEKSLNDAFIALAIAAYAGRSITVLLRAMALTGWDPLVISATPRQSRRARGW